MFKGNEYMEELLSVKFSAFSNILWKLSERFLAQIVSMVVSVVLARLLVPEDYSVVSIVAIFFTFCNIFISGGFNTALIQKKDADSLDYSSVFFVSIVIAFFLYIVMFIISPLIAKLYNNMLLVPVIRVMSLTFFINSYKGVLCAYVSNQLRFKNFFISTLVGTLISAVVGIYMAKKGFGAWALVTQQMTNATIDTLILSITSKMDINFKISFVRLKKLFSYGWKMFATSIIAVTYDEMKPLIIGVKYMPVELAFYNKGRSFPMLINSTITDSVSAVLFPIISKVQDDRSAVLGVTRRYMQVSSYIVFPLLLGFFAISENFIKLLLTEKWLPASPYIKIFCVDFLFNIIQVGNQQAVKAIGRSDIILKTEIIKKTLYFIVIFMFVILFDSPYMIAISSIVCTMIATAINTFPNVKLIGYTYKKQIVDLLPNMVISLIMAGIVMLIGKINIPVLLLMPIQVIAGVVFYLLLSILTNNSNFKYLISVLRESVGK